MGTYMAPFMGFVMRKILVGWLHHPPSTLYPACGVVVAAAFGGEVTVPAAEEGWIHHLTLPHWHPTIDSLEASWHSRYH